jgi:hypothetical membrane protein
MTRGAPLPDSGSMRKVIAISAIVAQLVFVGGWLLLGLLEGHGYQPGRHDISDLGALTAHHATADRLTLFVAGALTIAFAMSLRPSFGGAAWLLALSLPGYDTLTDAFFRLDCRAADAGCDTAAAMASWHGKVHIVDFVVSALATLAVSFVLARRMRRIEGWTELARPTTVFGVLVVAVLVATAATAGTAIQGWTQRGAAVVVCTGVVVLAWRALQLESRRGVAVLTGAR